MSPAPALSPASRRLRRRRLVRGTIALLLLVLGGGLAGVLALGSRAVNQAVDRRSLRMLAARVVGAARIGPPVPRAALPFHAAAELEALTRPAPLGGVALVPLARHRRDHAGVTEEELSFASRIAVRAAASNRARVHVHRHGRLGERAIVLWVPGFYVIDAAFLAIDRFVDEALARGADVLVYEPPYHLRRTPAGAGSGDALVTTDLPDHFNALAQELGDLRDLVAHLRGLGPGALGAFGGSLGGTMLLRLATWDAGLDFLVLMMPPVHLGAVMLSPPELAPVRERLRREGWSLDEVAAAYQAFDADAGRPRLGPGRISFLHGAWDGLAPLADAQALAGAWGAPPVRLLPRGHALILTSPDLYRAWAEILARELPPGRR